jgi:hypothetical protein
MTLALSLAIAIILGTFTTIILIGAGFIIFGIYCLFKKIIESLIL